MLVLTRKSNESVALADPSALERMIKITVLEIRGGRVKLGFAAGTDVTVHRREVWERIHAGTCTLTPHHTGGVIGV